MDVIAAYRDVGSYRGAAEICGTTHKTVRRIIEAHEAGQRPGRQVRGRNFDQVRPESRSEGGGVMNELGGTVNVAEWSLMGAIISDRRAASWKLLSRAPTPPCRPAIKLIPN